MKKILITFLLFCFITLLFFPLSIKAATSSSNNYQLTDQIDYGGGTMESDKYSLFGFITDIGNVSFWLFMPDVTADEEVISQPGKIPPAVNSIDKNILVGENKLTLTGEIGQLKIVGDLTLDNLAKGLDIPVMAAVAGLTLAVSFVPVLFNLSLLAPFSSIWASFLSLFGFGKGRKKWGVVYDTETKRPIPLAVVQIFDKEYNKLLNTQITDREGRFSFLVQPGKYYIRVNKKNYVFPSKMDSFGYHGHDMVLSSSEVVNFNIPLDPQIKTLAHRINVLAVIQRYFEYTRIPLLVFGTLISTWLYVVDGGYLNLGFLVIYVIIWITELYKLRQSRTMGKTFEEVTHVPLDLTILRLFNKGDKLVSTRVSDQKGQFKFLVDPGNYYLTAIKQDYSPFKTGNLNFSKAAAINLDVPLKKQIIPGPITDKPIIKHHTKLRSSQSRESTSQGDTFWKVPNT